MTVRQWVILGCLAGGAAGGLFAARPAVAADGLAKAPAATSPADEGDSLSGAIGFKLSKTLHYGKIRAESVRRPCDNPGGEPGTAPVARKKSGVATRSSASGWGSGSVFGCPSYRTLEFEPHSRYGKSEMAPALCTPGSCSIAVSAGCRNLEIPLVSGY